MENYDNKSFRDFEYIAGKDVWERAKLFQAYLGSAEKLKI